MIDIMHIEQVEIRRLLGFEYLKIEVAKDLQLIAGPNNAGKSSLVKILETFFSDPNTSDIQALQPLNEYYRNGGARMLSSIKIHFCGLTGDELKIPGHAVTTDGSFWVSIESTRTGKIQYKTKNNSGTESRIIYEHVLQSFDFVKIPSVRVNDADQSDTDQSMSRLYKTLEGILVRSGNKRSTQLQKEFARVIAPVEELVRDVLEQSLSAVATELPFEEPILGVELPSSQFAVRGMLQEATIKSHDDAIVSIADRGTGFQSALVLGILRYISGQGAQSDTKAIFAIEEPEAFLHPQTQRAMAKILNEISTGAQLFVTTHSPVVVDSFPVDQIVRLPLMPEGVTFSYSRPELATNDVGKLTRYCDAANSELIFANAVILVEGHGDKLVVDYLLERITGGAGAHYALGITVIDATGISTIKHLLKLAELFSVRAYILTDKDGLHKNGSGKRVLVDIIKELNPKTLLNELNDLRSLADRKVATFKEALAHQNELNNSLEQWHAFVLSSDLEGLVLDTIGPRALAEMLGPTGRNEISSETEAEFSSGQKGREALASYLGSKGWNSTNKKTGKAKPHLPYDLLRTHLDTKPKTPQAIKPLWDWLNQIVNSQNRSTL